MTDRTIFITGASTGIGAASARILAAMGWKVALAARSAEKTAALAEEIGPQAKAIACDVRDEASVASAIAEAAAFGPLHAAFANAGIGATVPGSEAGETANWRDMIETNIWGVLTTVKHALPHLRATKGHMLLTGSRAGRISQPGSVYGATKWFVHGYGQNLALEMNEWGGRCTVIAPGMVDTPFFDTPKPGALTAEDVAAAVAHTLDQPAHVNTGEILLTPIR